MTATSLPPAVRAGGTRRISGFTVRAGDPLPFGATPGPDGITFSIHSNAATAMTLVLFRRGDAEPFAELPFPEEFRTGGVYSMTVLGLDPTTVEYGYRADGPYRPEAGYRFAPRRVLTDPYARAFGGLERWGSTPHPLDGYRYRARVVDDDFDWAGDQQLRLPMRDLVIYEAHVRGFTRHPSSGVRRPGTFAGLVEKIPYLTSLGVNCVELLPVFEFDETDLDRVDPSTGRRLRNYWGYHTLGFFAPKASYAASARVGGQITEFKYLVRQLHRAGIEVMLDVVLNHTAEGNELGPTISLRGLDDRAYYMLTGNGEYLNLSGTGNTINANDPVARAFLLDCLRYWVTEFHIDGFRFDLASILTRGPDGTPLANPPLLEAIAADPVLRDTKLVAEAWDAGGLYQVGSFPDYGRWSEWNGRFRDLVRRFLRGEAGTSGELATRLVGSPDLYRGRGPLASVNFVCSHDGFTLHDLFAYNVKHNAANGEDNRDGADDNYSWNCGHEGPTDNPEVLRLRARQVRNAMLLLLTSHGVPMLVAGDEMGRTQQGNNNAYCQDNELSWLDWGLQERNADLVEFTRRAIAFRRAHPALRRVTHVTGTSPGSALPDVSWHGERAWTPDWSTDRLLVAAMLRADEPDDGGEDVVFLAANAHWESCTVHLPELPPGLVWGRFADTSAPAPHDAYPPGLEPPLAEQSRITIGARSVVVLTALADPSQNRGAS
ncbi:glycogen debranching protein GlgX [Micromonospora sp. NPDC048935]|uniref:glycogen debranching protein GlgX n=1 Tax=Micromonospora sp. NPDC048935 TaxID=3364262 RepID=UPI00371358E4